MSGRGGGTWTTAGRAPRSVGDRLLVAPAAIVERRHDRAATGGGGELILAEGARLRTITGLAAALGLALFLIAVALCAAALDRRLPAATEVS